MTLNLKDPRGAEVFRRLAKGADIVVENYRPDVKFRLGIDYETLAKDNGETFDEDLTKAEASKRIDELRERSPRLSNADEE